MLTLFRAIVPRIHYFKHFRRRNAQDPCLPLGSIAVYRVVGFEGAGVVLELVALKCLEDDHRDARIDAKAQKEHGGKPFGHDGFGYVSIVAIEPPNDMVGHTDKYRNECWGQRVELQCSVMVLLVPATRVKNRSEVPGKDLQVLCKLYELFWQVFSKNFAKRR